MKKSAKDIKALPREVVFNSWEDRMWKGKSTGDIQEGVYLEVYVAHHLASSSKEKDTYEPCEHVKIPLSRIYRF